MRTREDELHERETCSVEEACRRLGIARSTGYSLARKKTLPGVRQLGSRFVVVVNELDTFLAASSTT